MAGVEDDLVTSHTLHPDSHEFGLADGCPRCAEHAERPVTGLDDRNLGVLARRLACGDAPRSGNERKAMYRLLDHVLATQQPPIDTSRVQSQSYYRGPHRSPY